MLLAALLLGATIAFADDEGAEGEGEVDAAPAPATRTPTHGAEPFRVTSDAFPPGDDIPSDHTCDGPDRSPPIHWSGAPEGTKAFAIVVEDPDAPGGTFVHWAVYNVPGAAQALDKGVPPAGELGDGSRQAKNDFGKVGWNGPCPPKGSKHDYRFRVFALSEPLDVLPGSGHRSVTAAMKGKILGKAELVGNYSRSADATR